MPSSALRGYSLSGFTERSSGVSSTSSMRFADALAFDIIRNIRDTDIIAIEISVKY